MRSVVRGMLVGAVLLLGAAPAVAAPGVGTPTVVTLGDSAISGEAGRWAGNTNGSSSRIDALGSTAYWDAPSGEAIKGCHRSKSAQAHIGGGVASANLACSGAQTSTTGTGSGQTFKPGIDFYSDASGRKGQAAALETYARSHNVSAVVVMIGANNYGFAAILERCVTNWITSPSWLKNYCSDDASMVSRFTAARQATETTNVSNALKRVSEAMTRAGYSASQYTIIPQTYWSPLPRGSGIRYPESGWTRQSIGGCGAWNRDLNWANDTVVPALNNSLKNGAAAVRPHQPQGARPPGLARRPPAVRDRGRPARGGRRRELAEPGRGRPHRVGRADPHHEHDHRPVPAAGGRPRELLGPEGDAQLPAARLQRRRRPRWEVRQGRQRPRRRTASRRWGCGRASRLRDRYDVIVVGARIGGSTLAALLGDAGVSVLLLDRARFPSTTPSTHFFRGAGMVGVLERLGVLDRVLVLGCPPLTRELHYADGGTEPEEAPPQDPGTIGYCLSVRRVAARLHPCRARTGERDGRLHRARERHRRRA